MGIGTAAGLLFLAALVVKIVDLIKSKAVPEGWSDSKLLWIWTLVSIAFGIGVAFGFHADMFVLFGFENYVWWLAQLLTGIALGAGATFLYDILDTDSRPGVK